MCARSCSGSASGNQGRKSLNVAKRASASPSSVSAWSVAFLIGASGERWGLISTRGGSSATEDLWTSSGSVAADLYLLEA